MKKIILILIVLINFFGCEYEEKENPLRKVQVGEKTDYRFDDSEIPKFETPFKYMRFINWNIRYENDVRNDGDYWQLPEETWKRKTGDCEDQTEFFMYLVETRLNIETKMTLVYNEKYGFHTIAKIGGIYFNITEFKTETEETLKAKGFSIIWNCPYYQVIWMTYYYHDNVGIYF